MKLSKPKGNLKMKRMKLLPWGSVKYEDNFKGRAVAYRDASPPSVGVILGPSKFGPTWAEVKWSGFQTTYEEQLSTLLIVEERKPRK